MDDYPNNSAAFMEDIPEERKEDEDREKARINSSIPVIQDILKWFADASDHYASVDSLAIQENTDPQTAVISVVVAKKMRDELKFKAEKFRTEFADHLQTED